MNKETELKSFNPEEHVVELLTKDDESADIIIDDDILHRCPHAVQATPNNPFVEALQPANPSKLFRTYECRMHGVLDGRIPSQSYIPRLALPNPHPAGWQDCKA